MIEIPLSASKLGLEATQSCNYIKSSIRTTLSAVTSLVLFSSLMGFSVATPPSCSYLPNKNLITNDFEQQWKQASFNNSKLIGTADFYPIDFEFDPTFMPSATIDFEGAFHLKDTTKLYDPQSFYNFSTKTSLFKKIALKISPIIKKWYPRFERITELNLVKPAPSNSTFHTDFYTRLIINLSADQIPMIKGDFWKTDQGETVQLIETISHKGKLKVKALASDQRQVIVPIKKLVENAQLSPLTTLLVPGIALKQQSELPYAFHPFNETPSILQAPFNRAIPVTHMIHSGPIKNGVSKLKDRYLLVAYFTPAFYLDDLD